MRNFIEKNLYKIIFVLTVLALLSSSLPVIYYFSKTEKPILEKIDNLISEQKDSTSQSTDVSTKVNENNEVNQTISGEVVIAMISMGVVFGGILLAIATVAVTYYFSQKVYNISESATEISLDAVIREERE